MLQRFLFRLLFSENGGLIGAAADCGNSRPRLWADFVNAETLRFPDKEAQLGLGAEMPKKNSNAKPLWDCGRGRSLRSQSWRRCGTSHWNRPPKSSQITFFFVENGTK
jgi:hypothetical protein